MKACIAFLTIISSSFALAIDNDDVRSDFRKFYLAMSGGDSIATSHFLSKSATMETRENIAAICKYAEARAQVREAVERRFGQDAAKDLVSLFDKPDGGTADKALIYVIGDVADVRFGQDYGGRAILVRTPNGWCATNLWSTYERPEKLLRFWADSAAYFRKIRNEVDAGRFKTVTELEKNFGGKMPNRATTTQSSE